jgi:ribose transport system permease protein
MPRVREVFAGRSYIFALLIAVALIIANLIALPALAKPSSWPGQLAAFAPFALVAMASTPAILSGNGGIDISVGPLMITTNVILVTWLLPHSGLDSGWVDIPILLAFGAFVGAVNGFFVAVLRYKSVIATLCTFFVLSGLVLKIAPQPITSSSNWTAPLAGKVGPIPGALFLIVAPLVIWFLLGRTPYLRTLFAVGGNDATTYSAGVDVTRTRLVAYALGGLIAAIGGIALTALVETTQVEAVGDYTLAALAAVALGGTAFTGGHGGLWGSLLGAVSIYLLPTLLVSLHVSATWEQFVYGALLAVGVIVGARFGTKTEAVAA